MGTTVQQLTGYQPLAILFEQLKEKDRAIFLDSSEHSGQGRFSFVGIDPIWTVEQVQDRCLLNGSPSDCSFYDTLQCQLNTMQEPNSTHLPMIAGALGYLSYDFGRANNGVPSRHTSSSSMPSASMTCYDTLLVEDLDGRRLYLCTQGQQRTSHDARDWAERLTASCRPIAAPARHYELAPFTSPFTAQTYQDALARMVEYMLDGHIYVANMTQTLTMQTNRHPYDIYRYLRTYNPAPFSAYIHGASFDVCCSSMERFLQVRNGHAVTRPIKGTRKRGATPAEDRANRQELFCSPKDNSELLMIVDLERNDLAISCKPGSVTTLPQFTVEDYPTVFHLVATVEGNLRDDATALDVVRHAFPGGSITGAPKRRAMEIIDELERGPRGLYTGSIGYVSAAGDCDLNVVIRTLVCQNGTATLGVGGGITAESDFNFEYEETLQKARAIREAVGAEEGPDSDG